MANIPAVIASGTGPSIGMHGERIDWLDRERGNTQLYQLGHGVRSYDPTLQCFLSRDPYSPFSVGGLNAYAFCGGDPVNRSDHSGYMSVGAGIGLGLSILGILLSVLSFGLSWVASLPFLGFVLAAVSGIQGVASGILGAVSAGLEESDPELSRTLGWLSLGLGIASMVTGMIIPGFAAYATRTGRLLINRTPQTTLGRRQLGLVKHTSRTDDGRIIQTFQHEETLAYFYAPRYRQGAMLETHGEIGAIQGFSGAYSRPGAVAMELMDSSVYVYADTPLYLFSCEAATSVPGELSNAAVIAQTMSRPVYAFNSPATIVSRMWEKPFFYMARGSNWGKLAVFRP